MVAHIFGQAAPSESHRAIGGLGQSPACPGAEGDGKESMRRLLLLTVSVAALAVGPALIDTTALATPEQVISESDIPPAWLGLEPYPEDVVAITWFADHHTGDVEVLWSSVAGIEVVDEDQKELIPQFVGSISGEAAQELADRLTELDLTAPRQLIDAAQAHIPPGTVCHLNMNPPQWQPAVDGLGASSNQHCLSGTTNHLEGRLQRKTWGPFYSTRDSDTDGWKAGETFVSMAVLCSSETAKDWRNLSIGKVIYGGEEYTVTLSTGWSSYGCVD